MSQSIYESSRLLDEYCLFHYGRSPKFFPHIERFPVICARVCQILLSHETALQSKPLRALDVGCAVGRATFELGRFCDEVIGVDYSTNFIDMAMKIQEAGRNVQFSSTIEGDIKEEHNMEFGSSVIPLDGTDGWKVLTDIFGSEIVDKTRSHSTVIRNFKDICNRVHFAHADACKLFSIVDQLGSPESFSIILAANLICRLYDPAKFLSDAANLVCPGGFLVLLSPCSWSTEYTPREKWLGGFEKFGTNVTTKLGLQHVLEPLNFQLIDILKYRKRFSDGNDFDLDSFLQSCGVLDLPVGGSVTSFHIPFIIQETSRKHQYTFSECTIWQKQCN